MSSVDKCDLCIRNLGVIDYVLNCTKMKILAFHDHDVIEDTYHKLIPVYNPLSHFYVRFLSDDVPHSHAITDFSMIYIGY